MPTWFAALVGLVEPWFVAYLPGRPSIRFDCRQAEGSMLTATAVLSAPAAEPPIAHRMIDYAIDGVAGPTFDAISQPFVATGNAGQTLAGTLTDVSVGGVKSQPASFSFVLADNVTVPATPTISFQCSPAPDPAPAPAPAGN